MGLCAKGLPDTAIKVRLSQKDTDVLGDYQGHGFALKTAGENGCIKDIGTVCLDVETLMSGDGGTGIDDGDILIHTAEYRKDGLYRAGRK